MLLGGNGKVPLLFIVQYLLITVEGKAVFHVSPHPVNGENLSGLEDYLEDGGERPRRVSLVEQVCNPFRAGQRSDAKDRADPEQIEEQDRDRNQGGDAQALEPKTRNSDQDKQSRAAAGEAGGDESGGRRQLA